MSWPERVIKSWNDFSEIFNKYDTTVVFSTIYAFRGQSCTEWGLKPSLLRKIEAFKLSVEAAIKVEQASVKLFLPHAMHYLNPSVIPNKTSIIDWLIIMQQYRAPTRLLDWTSSFHVAAYFASVERPNDDGIIWVVLEPAINEIMKKEYGGVFPKVQEDFSDPNSKEEIYFVNAGSNQTDRLIAQQGRFCLCKSIMGDHEKIIDDILTGDKDGSVHCKIIIPAKLKSEVLRKLRLMNITANSLFPGLDGIGKMIDEAISIAGAG